MDENLSKPWYAVVNDLIGGWSIAIRDAPSSQLDPGEELMDCGSEEVARYIVDLHNNGYHG